MNYFIKGLISGNRKYLIMVGALVVWLVAIIDVLSTAIGPPGLFNGKWFNATLILTFLSPVLYYGYDLFVRTDKKKKLKIVEGEAAWFEPQREKEIREIVEKNPEFVTLCYQCLHFNPDLLTCARKLSEDVTYQRVKEIGIKGKKYCLYWVEAPGDKPRSQPQG